MKRRIPFFFTLTLVLSLSIMLSACFHRAPVCHIASDIGLIVPRQTTKEEILSYLGPPAQQRSVAENEEEWLYFQSYDSLMRKMPVVGDKLGECQYDIAIIRFKDNIVSSSQYRDLSEAEFKQLGIEESAPE